MKQVYITSASSFPSFLISFLLSFLPHSSHLFSQSTHSSPFLLSLLLLSHFLLSHSPVTLPLLPFTSSLSTSSLTLLRPFTLSSPFHSFIPKLPSLPFFSFSRPSCHLLLFSHSFCSYPCPPLPTFLSSCSAVSAVLLAFD